MSDPVSTEIAKRIRIILELGPDGSVTIEQYINGSRYREKVPPGFERQYALDALARQKRDIDAEAERKAEKLDAEEKRRHRNVYWTTRFNHGEAFANKTVGNLPATAATAKQARAAKAFPSPGKANLTFAEALDLL